MRALMTDIETLSITGNAVVMQFAAVPFDLKTGNPVGPGFTTGFDVQGQLAKGRVIDNETLIWWLKQYEEPQQDIAAAMARVKGIENDATLLSIARWIRNEFTNENAQEVWSSGCAFDIPILESMFADYNVFTPWEFHQVRDLRTLRAFVNLDKQEVQKPKGDVKEHTALYDCHWQINQYKACMAKIQDATAVDMEEIRNAVSE